MFFSFSSDYLYEEDDWPWVWELEKEIQAFILAMREDLTDLDLNGLHEKIVHHLEKTNFPSTSIAPRLAREKVWDYLRREVTHIADFIKSIAVAPDFSCPRDLGLMPLPRFQQAISASKKFRQHLLGCINSDMDSRQRWPGKSRQLHRKNLSSDRSMP